MGSPILILVATNGLVALCDPVVLAAVSGRGERGRLPRLGGHRGGRARTRYARRRVPLGGVCTTRDELLQCCSGTGRPVTELGLGFTRRRQGAWDPAIAAPATGPTMSSGAGRAGHCWGRAASPAPRCPIHPANEGCRTPIGRLGRGSHRVALGRRGAPRRWGAAIEDHNIPAPACRPFGLPATGTGDRPTASRSPAAVAPTGPSVPAEDARLGHRAPGAR